MLGQPERIDLHSVAEQALLGIIDAVALRGDLVPELREGAHLADLGDEAQPGIDEERDAPDHVAERRGLDCARTLHGVEHGDRGGEREGKLLHRRRARLLQVIGADVHRVPLRHLPGGEEDRVLGEPKRGRGRKHVRAAREIFLDDVVLGRAGELFAGNALLVGERRVEREEPRGRRVDRHRRVHLAERDLVEQRAHVAEMRHRHADLADLAARQDMVGVVAGLGRQIEGDGKAGLPLAEVLAIERVRFARGGVAGVGAENPGPVPLLTVQWLAHGPRPARPAHRPACGCAMHHTPIAVAREIIEQPRPRGDPTGSPQAKSSARSGARYRLMKPIMAKRITAPITPSTIEPMKPENGTKPNVESSHEPMKAPTMPMTIFQSRPKPNPRMIWPASQPAIAPAISEPMMPTPCMTSSPCETSDARSYRLAPHRPALLRERVVDGRHQRRISRRMNNRITAPTVAVTMELINALPIIGR